MIKLYKLGGGGREYKGLPETGTPCSQVFAFHHETQVDNR